MEFSDFIRQFFRTIGGYASGRRKRKQRPCGRAGNTFAEKNGKKFGAYWLILYFCTAFATNGRLAQLV